MKTIRRELTFDRLFGCQYRYVEWCLVFWGLLWGLQLLSGNVDLSRPAYRIMVDVTTELGLPFVWSYYIWGVPEIVLAFGLMFGILRDRMGVRKHSLLGLTVFWFFVSLSLGLPNYASTALPMYPPLCFLHCMAYLRISGRSNREYTRGIGQH